MVPLRKTSTGLAFLTLSLVARQSKAQIGIETCDDLISSIEGGDTSFELLSDITCTETITIEADMVISIDGGSKTLTISESIVGSNAAAAFYSQGTLDVTDLTITPESQIAVRGIFNEGDLIVRSCTFEDLNVLEDSLDDGGAIYSNAEGATVVIENSVFQSNLASVKGGAICAVGTETVEVYNSEFQYNEAGINDDGSGSGGDIYAADGVTLKVQSSKFISSFAEYGGAAIECCGANITDCTFTGAESDGSQSSEHYGGALLVGRPDYGECQHELFVDSTTFSSCVVSSSNGVGGSIAIFDTSASLKDCVFDESQGTAVLFQSSSASGNHEISMESVEFYHNSRPALEYANDNVFQGAAFVLKNTAAVEGKNVTMGALDTIHCFSNDPYECEGLNEGAAIFLTGEVKCQICNLETDLISDEELPTSSSGSSSFEDPLIIGLVAGLAVSWVALICTVCAMKWLCVEGRTGPKRSTHTAAATVTGTQPSGSAATAPPDPSSTSQQTATA